MFKVFLAAIATLTVTAWAVGGAQAAGEARVRVLHASPDAPAVDVYANGNKVLSNLAFKSASDYLTVPAGTYKFDVRPAGAAADSAPVLSAMADLQAGTDYTVAAVNKLAQIQAKVFVDNNVAPAAGKAHIQVIHASPDAPAVDIAVKGGPLLVSNLPFGEQQGPLPADAGTYDLEVRVAGTSNVVLPLNGVQLQAGKVYTFVAVGLANGNPSLSVVPLTYTPATTVMTPPSTGDAGLLDEQSSSANNLYAALGAIATAVTLSMLFAARLARVRARNR